MRRRASGRTGWLLVAAAVLLAWPVQLGGSLGLVIVAGHSMDGTYRSGDLLLTWKHDRYQRGDVIVYRVPDQQVGSGLRVVHRIVAGDNRTGFTTQGDNRATTDIWRPLPKDIDGRPFLVVPHGGVLVRWLLSPLALALLCAVCVYLLVASTGREPSDQPDPGGRPPDQQADPADEDDGEIVDVPTYARPRDDERIPTS